MNLEDMTIDQLKAFRKEIDHALVTYEARRRAEVRAKLEAQARAMGFRLEEIVSPSGKRKSKGIPKYFNPDNPTVTWTGKGRRPQWFKTAIAEGKSEDDLMI